MADNDTTNRRGWSQAVEGEENEPVPGEGAPVRDRTEALKAPILMRGADDQLTRSSVYQEIGYEGRE